MKSTLYCGFIAAMCLLQFFPLQSDMNISASNSPILISLQDPTLRLVAAFCLGFLGIIVTDLIVDFLSARYTRWISRSFYLWITMIPCIAVLGFSNAPMIGPFYICFQAFSNVFYPGRAMLDLIHLDTTNSWNYPFCTLILLLLGIGNVLRTYDIHSYNSTPATSSSQGIAAATGVLFTLNVLYCFYNVLRKNNTESFFNRVRLLTARDCIQVGLMSLILLLAILYFALSYLLQDATEQRGWSTLHLAIDLSLRVFFATSLEILPTLIYRQSTQTLQNDLNMKSTFVRYVGHEIRTPLNIAVVGLDVLKRLKKKRGSTSSHFGEHSPGALTPRGEAAAEDEYHMLEEIEDSCKVAVTLIDDLLAYEKVSSGILELDKTLVHVAAFLQTTVSLFNIQARSKNVIIRVLQQPGVVDKHVVFEIDYAKLSQVMRNLISNAIKFTPENGIIDVDAFEAPAANGETNSTVILQVKDSGVGISEENISKVFHEIIQFDAARLQGGGGSGIGLWISKKIVNLHGGTVNVFSEGIGYGCTFQISIPRAPGAVRRRNSHQHARRVSPTPANKVDDLRDAVDTVSGKVLQRMITGKAEMAVHPEESTTFDAEEVFKLPPMRALLVDDSKLNRKFMARLFTLMHISVDEAEDGEICVARVCSFESLDTYNLVIMDSQMPNMNGAEATKALRKLGFTGFIVGLTGDAAPENFSSFMNNGADDVLMKPTTYDQMNACLIDCVRRRKKGHKPVGMV